MKRQPSDPGWYPDAEDRTRERWWDGGEWSRVTRPAAGAAPPAGSGPGPAGPALGAPPLPARVPVPITTPDGRPLAAPVSRLAARLLDGLLVAVLTTVVGWPWMRQLMDLISERAAVDPRAMPGPAQFEDLFRDSRYLSAASALGAVQLVVSALYHVLWVRLRGATPGKLALGIRVRTWLEDGRPGWRRAVLRWAATDLPLLLQVVAFAYLVLDPLWLLWDPRRQSLHDKAAGTVVVRSRRVNR